MRGRMLGLWMMMNRDIKHWRMGWKMKSHYDMKWMGMIV